jgi:uncharacterized damage-inducible protein DinB
MSRYDFLVDSYRTERLKTLSVWSQVPDARFDARIEPRARSPHEHMVHQCVSEDTWMRTMMGIAVTPPALPPHETTRDFIEHYVAVSGERLKQLEQCTDGWFEAETRFFDVTRSRAWVLTRRLTHTSHHRGQLLACLRLWGEALYSTYGTTADTGGLAPDGATVIYRYDSLEALLDGRVTATLPGPGAKKPTERPGGTR